MMPNWCENYLEVRGPEDELRPLRVVLDAEALEAGVETVDDRIEHRPGAVVVAYPTKWTPPLEAIVELSERFPALTFTLIYYEFNMGLRGYAVYGPDGASRTCHEENVDLYEEKHLFPCTYPVPAGSELWAATARSDR
jgi:hypothetical protein